MQFVFKRDEEGRERIYVGDVCVAVNDPQAYIERTFDPVTTPTWLRKEMVFDAIDRADEAGFWDKHDDWYRRHEVTVDVPVADNAVLSVTVGGDES